MDSRLEKHIKSKTIPYLRSIGGDVPYSISRTITYALVKATECPSSKAYIKLSGKRPLLSGFSVITEQSPVVIASLKEFIECNGVTDIFVDAENLLDTIYEWTTEQ